MQDLPDVDSVRPEPIAAASWHARSAPLALSLPATVLGVASFGLYAATRVAIGVHDPVGVGLAAVPLFFAAAFLPRTSALLLGLATILWTVVPLVVDPLPWSATDLAIASELTVLVVAALALREGMLRAAIASARAATSEKLVSDSWARQLAVIQAASGRMSRQNTIESVGRAIVEEIGQIIDYHNCRVYQLVDSTDLIPIAFEGRVGAYEMVDLAVLRTKVGEGFTGWVAATGQPLLINDANADPRGSTIPGTDDIDESMLCVPMRYDERVIGVITLSKLGLGQFDEDNQRLLMILADQAATAVESARLLTRSERLAIELRRLLDMSGDLSQSLDSREVAELIARHLVAAMEVDLCIVSWWDRPGDRLLTLGTWPLPARDTVGAAFDLAGFPETVRVLAEQATSIIDVDDPCSDSAEIAYLRDQGDVISVMLPLVAKGRSIGLLELMSGTRVVFDEPALELARTMANEAAMALENARHYEDMRNLADRDQLTGFFNHRYLHQRLGEEIVRARRSGSPLALLMIDLDDFKLVNDTFGHLLGDRLLGWTAEQIRSTLRASDIPARYGGDEFAVILPETDGHAAEAAARRILKALKDRVYASDERGAVPVASSIGIASYPADGRSGQELIAAADQRMYRIKDEGGRGASRKDGMGGGTRRGSARRSSQSGGVRRSEDSGPVSASRAEASGSASPGSP